MLVFLAWSVAIFAGFLIVCAALGSFLQWLERESDGGPNRSAPIDHIKRLPQ
jgi:hypothetical protein